MGPYDRPRWLRFGAVSAFLLLAAAAWGEEARPRDLASFDRLIKPSDRQHWAFQPVRRPPVPAVKDDQWARNPIDAFILSRLEARGWQPSPAAPPHALLRRLYLDLIGLPPTPAEQAAFLKDPSPAAFDAVVNDLLARPAYGERWARHWLDLVRYAETNGYERDATKPQVWRYRDYIIRAFNDDKPYDRFILEQLAGDELPDADAGSLIAAGLHRLGPWDDEPADPDEDRFDQLDDMVSTTSLAFLGLTLACARCHNHKFEPLTQHDYYRMVAIFAPLRRPQKGRTELDLPAVPPAQLAHDRARVISQGLAALGSPLAVLTPVSRSPAASASRPASPPLPRGYFLYESGPAPAATHLLIRGKASRPGPEVQPGLPAVLVVNQPPFPSPRGPTSQRRLTLARWVASPNNPLTARVLVNRVWQHHFGEGLVRTPSDFGVQGQPPTHPELLDWLADWCMREGWSIKKLHRLILTSNTYRMSKRWRPDYGTADPEDKLLWRVPYRRLEVEVLRDSMLAISGRLNPRMYGPSMYPQVPRAALAGHSDPDKIWKSFDETEASRRTIYAFLKRSMVVPLLEVLDLCDTARSSAQRPVTTVAPQALTLFNGDFVNRQARHLARRLEAEAGADAARQIDRAYVLALCRPPTPTERAALLAFLEAETKQQWAEGVRDPAAAGARAREQMCRVILNLNELAYPD